MIAVALVGVKERRRTILIQELEYFRKGEVLCPDFVARVVQVIVVPGGHQPVQGTRVYPPVESGWVLSRGRRRPVDQGG